MNLFRKQLLLTHDAISLRCVFLLPKRLKIRVMKASALLSCLFKVEGFARKNVIHFPSAATVIIPCHSWFEPRLKVSDKKCNCASGEAFGSPALAPRSQGEVYSSPKRFLYSYLGIVFLSLFGFLSMPAYVFRVLLGEQLIAKPQFLFMAVGVCFLVSVLNLTLSCKLFRSHPNLNYAAASHFSYNGPQHRPDSGSSVPLVWSYVSIKLIAWNNDSVRVSGPLFVGST